MKTMKKLKKISKLEKQTAVRMAFHSRREYLLNAWCDAFHCNGDVAYWADSIERFNDVAIALGHSYDAIERYIEADLKPEPKPEANSTQLPSWEAFFPTPEDLVAHDGSRD
jgi:hypothetical protein